MKLLMLYLLVGYVSALMGIAMMRTIIGKALCLCLAALMALAATVLVMTE